jgi:threonyl-tRNA synthetase
MSEEYSKIYKIRHSLSHLLARAVLDLYPNAQPTIGPAIDNGFYYDFHFSEPISEKDLKKIEKHMRKILPTWHAFTAQEIAYDDAKKYFADNPFKLELIDDIHATGDTLTCYTSGSEKTEFTDLCRGGHVDDMAQEVSPESFMLDRIAGAYWRGDEKNPMLTRMYGLAFETKEQLEEYLALRQEAEKRDHRKLGKELELFAFDDEVGPGLPLWLPKGTILVEELEKLAKETEYAHGYDRVRSPHITKGKLYETSGHLPYYADSMFPPMELDGEKYYLKPMNCPHHHKIFHAIPKSYRDLPVRYGEYGHCYRYEDSGALFGLMRVRSLCMNDAHIYCTPEQFEAEFMDVIQMYLYYFKLFGIQKYQMRLSKHAASGLGKKYVDEPELWKQTEDEVRRVLVKANVPFIEVEDEAAFYGPKIDVQIWSVIGREFTLATNQLDFAVPKRFGLVYTDRDGQEKTPLCIHRAPLSTHERFIGFLIEHFAGAFPVWMSPVQVAIIPVSGEHHKAYAETIFTALKEIEVRTELLLDDSLGKRIRNAKVKKIPYQIIIGDTEQENNTVTVEGRNDVKLAGISLDTFMTKITQEITNRTL